MAAAAGPGHAPELIAKEVAFGNGQIRKGGNTLTIEAVAPAPGFTECFFGLDRLTVPVLLLAVQCVPYWKVLV